MRWTRCAIAVFAGSAVLGLAAVVLAQAAGEATKERPAMLPPGLERIKKLAGDWVEAKGADGSVTASYRVTSAGSAVAETLFPGTDHEMLTVYFRDGDDIVLTHYCSLGNQPRMKAERGGDEKKLAFKFDGGTNIKPEKDAHMHAMTLTFVDDGHISAEWTYFEDGKAGHTTIFDLVRKKE